MTDPASQPSEPPRDKDQDADDASLVDQIMAAHLYCTGCGYDVTGARDQCPECGQFIDEDDCETVTTRYEARSNETFEQVGTVVARMLAYGLILVFVLAFIAALVALLANTERIFPSSLLD